jgi:ABC-type phosphate transport system permease subunit
MLKLHPALAVVWYVGRREWRHLAWYAGALLILTLIQLPWLPVTVQFYVSDPVATETIPGMSLRSIGTVPWLLGTLAVGIAALWFARTPYGWLLATVLQFVALPRVLLVNLALLLAAPLPRPAVEDATGQPTPAPAARTG